MTSDETRLALQKSQLRKQALNAIIEAKGRLGVFKITHDSREWPDIDKLLETAQAKLNELKKLDGANEDGRLT
jgi:hypothetical protein